MQNKLYNPIRHTTSEITQVPEFDDVLETYHKMVENYASGLTTEQDPDFTVYGGFAGVTFLYQKVIGLAEPYQLASHFDSNWKEKYTDFAHSYFFGELGIKISVALSRGLKLELSDTELQSILEDEHNEILYGAPGALIGLTLLRHENLFDDDSTLKKTADHILANFETDEILWIQKFPEFSVKCLGAAHGAIGNLHSLSIYASSTKDSKLLSKVKDLTMAFCTKYVVRQGGYANLQKSTDQEELLLQWCHGAPGLLTSLHSIFGGSIPDQLSPLVSALSATIIDAGPLTKAPSLCHGDAGNSLALLAASEMLLDPQLQAEAYKLYLSALCRHKEFGPSEIGLWNGLGGIIWAEKCFRNGYSALPFLDFLPSQLG